MKTSRCKSCGAEIVWAQTPNGKHMPLDARPEKRAVLTSSSSDGPTVAMIKDTYMPHWSTCPNADSHRRRE